MKISCLLLAAGSSSRMGEKNKLMLKVDGESLVKKTLNEILKAPLEKTIVITGHSSELIKDELLSLGPDFVQNDHYSLGMHTSIKRGVEALPKDCDAFFVCLSDQPYFDHKVLLTLMKKFEPGNILAPSFHGKRGHPVLISAQYISEILNEPDGDYGCAYLLKRHPENVKDIPVEHEGILMDVDDPQDYAKVLDNSYNVIDPVSSFHSKVQELRENRESFAIASIIEVIGSASARTGSKAIFSKAGKNLLGWVGGGCAERFIGEESVAAIKEARTRIILADLDDEIFGLGVACGGKMRVFIEPIIPSETITLPHSDKYQNEIRSLSSFYGWNVKKDFKKSSPETIEALLLLMSKTVAQSRGKSLEPLRRIKKVPAHFQEFRIGETKQVTIVGRTRITEALARHLTLLNFKVRAIGPDLNQVDYPSSVTCSCLDDGYGEISFSPNEMVIIASHTSQDPEMVKNALNAGASYVGMIGSYKRSEEVLTHLGLMNQDVPYPLSIPAGLDLDARNPDEIALSVVAEILTLKGEKL